MADQRLQELRKRVVEEGGEVSKVALSAELYRTGAVDYAQQVLEEAWASKPMWQCLIAPQTVFMLGEAAEDNIISGHFRNDTDDALWLQVRRDRG